MIIPKGNKLLLLQLLRAGNEMYGQQIMDETGLSQSSVYITLHRLEGDDGYLLSRDEKAPGEPGIARRYYKITGDGRRALAAAEAAMAILAR